MYRSIVNVAMKQNQFTVGPKKRRARGRVLTRIFGP